MSDAERTAKICLAHFPGFGSHRLRTLKQRGGSLASAWLARRRELMATGLPASVVDAFLEWRSQQDTSAMLTRLDKYGIKPVLSEDPGFPVNLHHSSDPPEVLFVRGNLPLSPAIAVVGTRKITAYGQQAVASLVPPLAQAKLCLVSGLALGVDGLVHRSCLDHHGTTLAFLPGGLDDEAIYPAAHLRLAREILEHGGCLVSESPPGTPGLKHLFPIRNRLIASFALATVVVEATLHSGSLITAKLALEENREVLAVPGSIWSPQSEGTNHLLKLGAKVCTSAPDVLDALALDRPDLIAAARELLPLDHRDQEFLTHLTQPIHIDALTTLAKASIAHVSSQLSLLELQGHVQHLGGQVWVIKKYASSHC